MIINGKENLRRRVSSARFFRVVYETLLHPGSFYERLSPQGGYAPPIIFLFLCSLLFSIFGSFYTVQKNMLFAVVFFINAFLMPFVTAFLAYLATLFLCRHAFAYQAMLGITAYANVTLLLAWIPGFSWVTGIWTYSLIGLGMIKVGRITALRAFLTVLVTAGSLFVLIQFVIIAGGQR